MIRRLDAYAPWNIGNYSLDEANVKSASTQTWPRPGGVRGARHPLDPDRLSGLQLG